MTITKVKNKIEMHCKKLGHTKENCFEIVCYLPNWQTKRKGKYVANVTITETKFDDLGQNNS